MCPVVVYRSNTSRALQVNTAVVGTHGVPLSVHNIIVAVEQMIPDLQKKWTRFGDKRRVYTMKFRSDMIKYTYYTVGVNIKFP